MSISGAMSSAVSGLKAQSQALAVISDNLANSSTVGYKANTASFSSLITQQSTGSYYASGGVSASTNQNVGVQGLISSTSNATDIAIDGDGMLAVTYGVDGRELYFTRNGEFSIDSDGYLCNGNYYLQGYPTDADGKVIGGSTNSTDALEPIDTNIFSGYASATTTETIVANLPADAATGDTFTSSMEVYDSLGVSHSVEITWEKTNDNEWSLSVADPTRSNDSSVTSGTISGGPITLTFNTDGTLASTSPSPADLTVTGWTTGAADSTVILDLGEAGSTNRLTQYASNDDEPYVDLTRITPDGYEYGSLTGLAIEDDGTVTATYNNGYSRAIYKIPLATFSNVDGLAALSDSVYAQTSASGSYTLQEAGQGTTGVIQDYALESSTVDTTSEMTRMIVAQQAYSAASTVISTSRDMFDTLMSTVR